MFAAEDEKNKRKKEEEETKRERERTSSSDVNKNDWLEKLLRLQCKDKRVST